MKFYRYLLAGIFCVLVNPAAMADIRVIEDTHADYAAERALFSLAGQALKRGDLDSYRRLLRQLQDYPLVGYLHYNYLRPRLSSSSDAEIQGFLDNYGELAVSHYLHAAWLENLARQGRWEGFLHAYSSYAGTQSTALGCYALRARFHGGRPDPVSQAWLDEAEALWLVGHSQPDECDPVFAVLRDSPRMDNGLVWQRFRLAMDSHQLSLGKYLAKSLNVDGWEWAARWQAMYGNPQDTLRNAAWQSDDLLARELMSYGIKRLADRHAKAAANEWQRLKTEYNFSVEQRAMAERAIGIELALQREPEAVEWLAAVDPGQADQTVREWRVRAALAQQDWQAALEATDALQAEERAEDEWRYWRARALEQLAMQKSMPHPVENSQSKPDKAMAEEIYAELARERNYYGFLAADRLDRDYEIIDQPIEFSLEELARVKALPGIVRAREFYLLGRSADGRREWNHTLSSLDQRTLEITAVVASQWDWHDRAIVSAAQATHWDDLQLRFPRIFREQVYIHADQYDLDPAWVYGVMRQESAFMVDAGSSVGAMGLMQLMPATGTQVARSIGTPIVSSWELLDPDKNIRLGSAYLRQVLDRNGGHQVLATASYNAGPTRVKQWLPSNSALPADVWVEIVPFYETRGYIKAVLEFTTVFSHLLGRDIVPLSERMPAIGSVDEQA